MSRKIQPIRILQSVFITVLDPTFPINCVDQCALNLGSSHLYSVLIYTFTLRFVYIEKHYHGLDKLPRRYPPRVSCITISVTTTEAGDPMAVPCNCLECRLTKTIHLTLKTTSSHVVETSVTNNSSFQNYTHPDGHTI